MSTLCRHSITKVKKTHRHSLKLIQAFWSCTLTPSSTDLRHQWTVMLDEQLPDQHCVIRCQLLCNRSEGNFSVFIIVTLISCVISEIYEHTFLSSEPCTHLLEVPKQASSINIFSLTEDLCLKNGVLMYQFWHVDANLWFFMSPAWLLVVSACMIPLVSILEKCSNWKHFHHYKRLKSISSSRQCWFKILRNFIPLIIFWIILLYLESTAALQVSRKLCSFAI